VQAAAQTYSGVGQGHHTGSCLSCAREHYSLCTRHHAVSQTWQLLQLCALSTWLSGLHTAAAVHQQQYTVIMCLWHALQSAEVETIRCVWFEELPKPLHFFAAGRPQSLGQPLAQCSGAVLATLSAVAQVEGTSFQHGAAVTDLAVQ
jgi:hypothetical protein